MDPIWTIRLIAFAAVVAILFIHHLAGRNNDTW